MTTLCVATPVVTEEDAAVRAARRQRTTEQDPMMGELLASVAPSQGARPIVVESEDEDGAADVQGAARVAKRKHA